jgi:Permuted papain-like amidase enzyme, YaeF/YiiX, C92 family
MKRNLFQRIQILVIKIMAKITWSEHDGIPEADRVELRKMFAADYYIVATRRDNYLSSWFMNLGHWFLTGRWGYYTHVLMNTEDEVKTDDDFRFIEATGDGTHYSTLEDVLDGIESISLLKPKSMTVAEWTLCLDKAKTYLGLPYDNLFDLVNDEEINCVELVRNALMALPDYETRFAAFEAIVKKEKGKLTPTMFAECPDFEIVYTIKR